MKQLTIKPTLKRGRKHGARRGETFVELLVAVLVVAFASLLVAVMYSAAFQANLQAQESDDTYYDALSKMETMNEKTGDGIQVQITDGKNNQITVTADQFGNGTYSSYRKGANETP